MARITQNQYWRIVSKSCHLVLATKQNCEELERKKIAIPYYSCFTL